MSSDHDIMRLPDPPPPAPDARAAALQQALVRFDQKSAEDSQGMPTDIRLIERTAAPGEAAPGEATLPVPGDTPEPA